MNPTTELMVFTTILSLAIAYAWWVHFRVWILRQARHRNCQPEPLPHNRRQLNRRL